MPVFSDSPYSPTTGFATGGGVVHELAGAGLITNPPAAIAGRHGKGTAPGRAVPFVEPLTWGQGEWASFEPPLSRVPTNPVRTKVATHAGPEMQDSIWTAL